MMSEFWTTARTTNLTTAGVIAALGWFLCFYAAKYELARLGVATDAAWWPPRQWAIVQVWNAIRGVEAGPKWRLLWWGTMMWIYAISMLTLFPVVVYVVSLSLFK